TEAMPLHIPAARRPFRTLRFNRKAPLGEPCALCATASGAGLSLSRSISQILSLSSHPSERPTWTSAGNLQAVLFGLASGGVCPAAASPRRWCALTAPFHPCRPAVHVGRRTSAVCFCGTFPRVSPGRCLDHLALSFRDFAH